MNGPEFLYHPIVHAFKELLNITVGPPEFQQNLSNNTFTLLDLQNSLKVIGNVIDIKIFNDYLKLLRVTGYVLRFVNNLKIKANEQHLIRSKYLRSSEINVSEIYYSPRWQFIKFI